jgi:hypothetical protein
MNKRFALRLVILALLPLFLAGCVYNVANDPRYPTDYIVGATYRFKQPVYAENGERSLLGFFVTDYMLESLKPGETVEEYEEKARNTQMYPSYDERWSNIAGIVRPGAMIRITHVELDKSSFADTVSVRGQLIDVPWAKHSAYVNGISKRTDYPGNEVRATFLGVAVNTNILERVSH